MPFDTNKTSIAPGHEVIGYLEGEEDLKEVTRQTLLHKIM